MSVMAGITKYIQGALGAIDANNQALVLLSTTVILLAALVLQRVLAYRAHYSYYRAPSPPCRPFWWAVGHVEITERVADRHRLYTEWHEQYGPFVRIRIAHRSMLMVADPAAASAILTKGPSYVAQKPPEYTAFDVAHGLHGYNGMLTHQDEGTWRAARKAIAPAFTVSEIKKQYPLILQCLTEAMTGIDQTLASGQTDIDVEHHMMVGKSVRGWLQLATCGVLFDYAEGRHLWVARRRLAAYAEKIYDLLQERYGTTSPPEDDRSLAACLMRMTDKHNNQPTRGALVAEIRDSLTASETVPSTVMWTVYSIATRPKLQQQLQEELAAAGILTGRSSSSSTITAPAGSGAAGQPVAYQLQQLQQRLQRLRAVFSEGGPDLLKQLPLLQACLNESMRLYPAGAPGAPRMATEATQAGPCLVPAGIMVFPNIYAIMNYGKNWEQPEQYKPERWLNDEHAGKDPVTGAPRFVPFSLGPKACAGQNLAMLQTKIALALLLAGYEWSLAPSMGGEEGVAARTYLGVTIKVTNGLWLMAQPRT